jgi:hypothetical protein
MLNPSVLAHRDRPEGVNVELVLHLASVAGRTNNHAV